MAEWQKIVSSTISAIEDCASRGKELMLATTPVSDEVHPNLTS
jgi:hypothetical protein